MTSVRAVARHRQARPVQTWGTVLASSPAGAYRHLVVDAPAVAAGARPGQFVAVSVGGTDGPGGADTALLLRRSFSLHRADPQGGTVEVVVAGGGPGTRWVVGRRAGDAVQLAGPLGRGFRLPRRAEPCLLVGGGYGSAPLFWLAEALRARGCEVRLALGAATADRLFVAAAASRLTDRLALATEDGTTGLRGRVTDALADLLPGAAQVYACGPMAMLRAVSRLGAEHGLPVQCAVEESMACGIGVCMTCVLPVVGDDGLTRMVRCCVEGPVLDGASVRWDAVLAGPDGRGSLVPVDCLGAPAAGAH